MDEKVEIYVTILYIGLEWVENYSDIKLIGWCGGIHEEIGGNQGITNKKRERGKRQGLILEVLEMDQDVCILHITQVDSSLIIVATGEDLNYNIQDGNGMRNRSHP